MNNIRKEVRDLIAINEKIQSAMLQGDRITDDEASIIRMCAAELLDKVPEPRSADRFAKISEENNGNDGR